VKNLEHSAWLDSLAHKRDTLFARRGAGTMNRPAYHVLDATPQGTHADVLQRAQEFILAHYTENLSLERVAEQVALSSTYFSRVFKQTMGCTFVEYLTRVRLEEARHLLRTTTLSLAEISYAVGYQSPNYFSEVFKAVEGVTASSYRRNATASH